MEDLPPRISSIFPAAARTNLGLVIGTDVQAYDDELRDVASSTATKGDLLTSDGTDWLDFPVGADGYVLTASSTASNGLTWSNWTQISGVGTLLSGATGAGFTVNLDTSTLTCTNCLTGDSIAASIAGRSLTLTAASTTADSGYLQVGVEHTVND